jgi:ABC-2 type transport system ATP-binding protein
MTVLLSSHLLHQVQQVCDRIGIFVGGRLVTTGTIDELAAALEDRFAFSIGFTGVDDGRAVLEVDGVTSAAATRGAGR